MTCVHFVVDQAMCEIYSVFCQPIQKGYLFGDQMILFFDIKNKF